MTEIVSEQLNARLVFVRLTGLYLDCKNLAPSKSEVVREDKARILELTKDRVRIGYSAKLLFKPEGPFDINIDYTLLYRLSEETDEDKIAKSLSQLAYPAVARACMLIAVLTEQTGVIQPLITPPVYNDATSFSSE